jgi:protein CpxP
MKSQRENMKRPSLDERRAMHELIASDTFDKAKALFFLVWGQNVVDLVLRFQAGQRHRFMLRFHLIDQQFNANFEKHLTERNAPAGKMPAPAE